ncbi:MAG: HAD family hydrolase [Candidatus Parcubacteria bacterium]|nr:HAD family hydrolase [Candidatus Parcubacteria bacterium]
MIKGIIFDLDMCILDTHTLGDNVIKPVIDILHNSNLPQELKEKINYQLWTTSLDDVIDMYNIPEVIAEKMREAYRKLEVPDGIKSFGDENYITDLPVKKILVTTGYQKFQEAKIIKLGIANLFDEIIIDALDFKDKRKGKKLIFEEILASNNGGKKEVLVVGDNPSSELGAAKAIGIPTVQTLRPTVEKWSEADYHIAFLKELSGIINQLNNLTT